MLIFEEKEIKTDNEGYLKDISVWNKKIAKILAEKEGVAFSKETWEIVRFVHNFYLEFNIVPNMRLIVKEMIEKFGEKKGNSCYLYKIFPKGPDKQATKIAGLPKQIKCI